MRSTLWTALWPMLMLAPAVAQVTPNPCSVPAPNVPEYYADWINGQSKVSCVPSPAGTGTLPYIRANKAGMTVWMWCPVGTTWSLHRGAATWTWLSNNNVLTDGAAIAAAADPVGALGSMLSKNINTPMADPSLTPVWCPYLAEVRASRPPDVIQPPPLPVPGSWITSGLSTYTRTATGTLGSFAGMTTKGRACDCTKPLKIGVATYCTFFGAESLNIVAQCTKQ